MTISKYNKSIIVKRLTEVCEMADKITAAEFNILRYVNKFKVVDKKPIPTQCCLIGWMPMYMPQVGIKYSIEHSYVWQNHRVVLNPVNPRYYKSTSHLVSEYLGINYLLVDDIFMPSYKNYALKSKFTKLPIHKKKATVAQLVETIRKVIVMIETTNDLDYLLFKPKYVRKK